MMVWNCLVPAYGGSKMVLLGYDLFANAGALYIFDVVKRSWKRMLATASLGSGACAVSGDQFIVWGGEKDEYTRVLQSNALVFNMKTMLHLVPPPRSPHSRHNTDTAHTLRHHRP